MREGLILSTASLISTVANCGAAPSNKRLNFIQAQVSYLFAHSVSLFEYVNALISTIKLGRLSEGWMEKMRYSIGIHPRLQLNVRIIFFFKTLNCANQTQGSKQSKTSSMFQQGLSQSLAWQWHVRIGCSPDETCGATRPGRGAMKCAKTYSCNLLYGGAEIEHRISNKEHRMSKGWILLFAHSINYLYYEERRIQVSNIVNTSSYEMREGLFLAQPL